jgi:hypothetical protein
MRIQWLCDSAHRMKLLRESNIDFVLSRDVAKAFDCDCNIVTCRRNQAENGA